MTTRRRKPAARRAPARRIPTIAESRRRKHRMIVAARLFVAASGPLMIYGWMHDWTTDLRVFAAGISMVVFTFLSLHLIKRMIIVALACAGLYVMRAMVCHYYVFPDGPGRIDDPTAPWRRHLGIGRV